MMNENKNSATADLQEWLALELDGRNADPSILLRGFDKASEAGGTILKAGLWPDAHKPEAIAVSIREHQPREQDEQRKPRIFDYPAFAVMRALGVVGGSFRMNKNFDPADSNDDPRGLFYPAIMLPKPLNNLSMLRIIADAQPGYQIMHVERHQDDASPAGSHYDVRRRNLVPRHQGNAKYDRAELVAASLAAVRSGGGVSEADLKQILLDAFALLDKLALGRPQASAVEAAE